MPSTFLGLNTGLSGLNYFQNALNTTSHNISNSDTEGYTRQKVNGSAANPLDISARYGMMGTGVSSKEIQQQRNNYYDVKYWDANTKFNKYDIQDSYLNELQTYMNEISGDSGYTTWISKMSDALQDLADNPGDYTTRISYTLTADSFTDMINEMSANFQGTQKTINDEVELAVSEINSLAKQIYELSQQIISIELKGSNANDLRDQRNLCIDKLSQYAEVDVVEQNIMFGVGVDQVESHGKSLTVRIGGVILADDMTYNELMVAPRGQKVNETDAEGLVDVYWANADGTPGEKFVSVETKGKLAGLINVRDGNNAEGFEGKIDQVLEDEQAVVVKLDKSIDVRKLNIAAQGTITLNGREYMYDGWEAEYDAEGKLNNFRFNNMTMYSEKRIEVPARFPDTGLLTHTATIGAQNSVKGVPYYQTRLVEMVRTFSMYMNNLTTRDEVLDDGTHVKAVDENGDDGLDMFTAEMVPGTDFVLKDSVKVMEEAKNGTTGLTLKSSDQSYYRLTGLNWELNGKWKTDPSKVVTSYEDDIEQGNIEHTPVLDGIVFGMKDTGMFEQGALSQYMQAITTNMAVDIAKMKVFTKNQDDIRYAIDNQRKSVSGVDQNEEGADLVKFQNLYDLSSKVISVLNEVYDKLINQTGV